MNEVARTETAIQHLPDIIIPRIEITEGWAAEDCATPKDCDDAFAYLMAACAQIEYQIDMELAKRKPWDDVWLAKARCALKFKKAALQIVNQRRSTLNFAQTQTSKNTRDQRLLEIIRAQVPDVQFVEWVRLMERAQ